MKKNNIERVRKEGIFGFFYSLRGSTPTGTPVDAGGSLVGGRRAPLQWKITKIILILTLISIFSSLSLAYIVPLGVQGTVYNYNNPSQPVPSDVFFSINNTNSGFFISGNVGKIGDDGIYSAAVDGVKGDNIEIRAWNDEAQASINIQLLGSMKNVNLLLDITTPQKPPYIISNPNLTAIVGELYIYDVEGIDPNGDEITYTLLRKPDGMTINNGTGLIQWTPTISDVGRHLVVIFIWDEYGNQARQYYYLTVTETIGLSSSDNDNPHFEVLQQIINESSAVYNTNDGQNLQIIEQDNLITSISIQEDVGEIIVSESEDTPEDLNDFEEDQTTGYFKVYPRKLSDSSIDVEFRLSKDDIEERSIAEDNVSLFRKNDDGWTKLDTKKTGEDEDYVHYVSESDEFGEFVISSPVDIDKYEEDVRKNIEIESNSIASPFIIQGEITKSKKLIENKEIIITNLENNKVYSTWSGSNQLSGKYIVVIDGKIGDEIQIEIDDKIFYIILDSSQKIKDISLDELTILNSKSLFGLVLFLIPAIIISIILFRRKNE